ncbi:hypothetical protein [Pseudoalteromonas sp. MMG024]|uniref:condensin complex protein MksE n=1 Tax=Pseudoalteromonas sp. MMG024 TaxID=2909980 RepID=UPI001F263F07|nr:hypothetical protein [Pseudoalteromonas sp. MMG024]MCF6459176.1 hypothetical protein [Pseudoalteromonas sp. MMG024]
MFDQQFANTIDALLAGDVICPISQPDAFNYLSNEINAERINSHLHQTGRTLSTIEKELFYCSYTTFSPERKKVVKQTVKQIELELRPIVEFLSLILRSFNREESLYTGDEVKLSVLVGKIESDKSLQKSLERLVILSKHKPKDSVTDNTKQIIRYMVNVGILKQVDATVDIYVCTGKLAYVLAFMEFFKANKLEEFQTLDLDEPEQEGLF